MVERRSNEEDRTDARKIPIERRETEFNRGLSVGFHNRGMGRGDYAVLRVVDEEAHVVAKLVAIGFEGRRPTMDDVQPVQANALLFAAAPELYDACQAVLRQLLVFQRGGSRAFDDEIAQLEAAMTKATVLPQSEEQPSRGRFADHTIMDIDLGPDDDMEGTEDDRG